MLPIVTLSFQDNKMSAAYDFAPDERAEVVLAASFEGDGAKGTWSLREKGSVEEGLSGTGTVRRSSKD